MRHKNVAMKLSALCMIGVLLAGAAGCSSNPRKLVGLADPSLASYKQKVDIPISVKDILAQARSHRSYAKLWRVIRDEQQGWDWAVACYWVYYSWGYSTGRSSVGVGTLVLYQDQKGLGYWTNSGWLPEYESSGPIGGGSSIRHCRVLEGGRLSRSTTQSDIVDGRALLHQIVERYLGASSIEKEGGATEGTDLLLVEVMSPGSRGCVFGVNAVYPTDLPTDTGFTEIEGLTLTMQDVVRLWRICALGSASNGEE